MRPFHSMAMLFFCIIIFSGCGASISIPSRQESSTTIDRLRPLLDSLDKTITGQSSALPKGHDLVSRTRSSAVNLLLAGVTNRSQRDIHIDVRATRPLWKEDRSILGIRYTNYIDVDTSAVDIDLKQFVFNRFSNNLIESRIEIEGAGKIHASGSYTGVWGRVSPNVQFYLDDSVQFIVTTAGSDYIRLTPVPKTVMLKTRTTIALLGWDVPYYKEMPLRVNDLIKPVLIPSALRSEIIFPVPAAQYGGQRLAFVKRYLRFTKSTVRADHDVVEYRSNIDFEHE